MRLKSLELVGFKSFLDATVISFSSGVTAVVGPNGCGKSNVVDAIRWVLGEQAPTRLRGKSAEDLLYAGNDANAPAGMAEVTLLLEGEAGSELPEPYAQLSEVAVTRRVYRSGDSEYLLNRIPCRLKDITEFFMAAQIHSRGYALIEQGRIEEIISAKPAELRTMVEEAAGLSLFKGRREMSERKLERVRENLARLDDVLSEIDRQLNFARRQAKKAETYRVIRDELAELERLAAGRRLLDLTTELTNQSERAAALHDQALEGQRATAEAQTRAEGLGQALAMAEAEFATVGRELDGLRVTLEERARTRGFLERRLAAITQLAPETERRLNDLELRATHSRAARAAAGARLARARGAQAAIDEAALARMREDHREAERVMRAGERAAEELRDEVAELMREAAVVRGRLGDLAGERAEIEPRLAAFVAEAPAIQATADRARVDLATAANGLAAVQGEAEHHETLRREAAEHEIEARAALGHHASRTQAANETLLQARARAQRILPVSAGEKLQTVLESLNGDGPVVAPAMLLDVIKAPPALEPALRAVLGDQVDGVIVESPDFALRAIEILKQRTAGRLSFIAENVTAAAVHAPLVADGITGRLLDMVEVEPRFIPLAEALMGHVVVAEDLRVALAAANLNGYGTVFVTREGDLLWPDRVISGGSGARAQDGEFSAFRDRTLALEAAERNLAALTADEALLRERLAVQSGERQTADQAAAALRRRVTEAESETGRMRAAIARADQQAALASAHHANAERRLSELREAAATANRRMEELARLEQEARTRLGQAAEEVATRRAAARALAETMLASAAELEARKAALSDRERELSHARQIADEVEAQIGQLRAEAERTRAEAVDFGRELETLAAQEATGTARRAELEGIARDLAARREASATAAAIAQESLEQARAALAQVEAETVECGLKCERARALTEELERAFEEKFHTAFVTVAETITAALANRDARQDDERLAALRVKAERLGEVNLAAESEVKELEARAGALGGERSDLQAAVNDLTQTIQKLNREARKRFAETFEGAAANFAELFPKLLRGGKGRLELTAGDDVLEAGVNILMQPAGKKVKEIGLLSGGEKALSAMALIFSLFLLNPSPFCIMDEVDAPLDEFSLAAFTSLVGELKQHSQFIIITHNQRTMQSADHIHGVTMERPGVSRIVSLKIPQAA